MVKSVNDISRSPPAVHRTRVIRGNALRHSSASSRISSARRSRGVTRCNTADRSPPHASIEVSFHAHGAPATAAANAHPPWGDTPLLSARVTRPAPVPTSTLTRNSRPTRSVSSHPPAPERPSRCHGATRLSTASSSPRRRAASPAARMRSAAAARADAPPSSLAAAAVSASSVALASANRLAALATSAPISPPRRWSRSIVPFALDSSDSSLRMWALRSARAVRTPLRVDSLALRCASTSFNFAIRSRSDSSRASAARSASLATSRECSTLDAVLSSAARACASESATARSVRSLCPVCSSLASSWHSFFSALPARWSASTWPGSSDAARRTSGGCAASTSARSLSTSRAYWDSASDMCSWSGSSASIIGAVRQTSLRPSVTLLGGGAVARDSIASDFLRRFLASMKDTSHACRNDSKSTGRAFSSKPLGIGGRSAGNPRNPSALVSLTVLAP